MSDPDKELVSPTEQHVGRFDDRTAQSKRARRDPDSAASPARIHPFAPAEIITLAKGGLTPGESQVLAYAHLHASAGERFSLPRARVMDCTGLSERSFERAIGGLTRKGLLEGQKHSGRLTLYRLVMADDAGRNDMPEGEAEEGATTETTPAAIWRSWEDACRRHGRRAVPDGGETKALRSLADLVRLGNLTSADLEQCMEDYMLDEDRRLQSLGHPLALLPKRLRRYLNDPLGRSAAPVVPPSDLIEEIEQAVREDHVFGAGGIDGQDGT